MSQEQTPKEESRTKLNTWVGQAALGGDISWVLSEGRCMLGLRKAGTERNNGVDTKRATKRNTFKLRLCGQPGPGSRGARTRGGQYLLTFHLDIKADISAELSQYLPCGLQCLEVADERSVVYAPLSGTLVVHLHARRRKGKTTRTYMGGVGGWTSTRSSKKSATPRWLPYVVCAFQRQSD